MMAAMIGVRAVICDVYQTLLAVGPGLADAESRWMQLHSDVFGEAPVLSLVGFAAGCREIVARDHAAAHAQGIAWPEVVWERVLERVLPEFASLDSATAAEFAYRHMQLGRSIKAADGAITFLTACRDHGLHLGIASNAQSYTLRELASCGIDVGWFNPDLCAWSFLNGFSKPDPHVFRQLTVRLARLGVAPAEILMVGDHSDNDIAPARAAGWQTWQCDPSRTINLFPGWDAASHRRSGAR